MFTLTVGYLDSLNFLGYISEWIETIPFESSGYYKLLI